MPTIPLVGLSTANNDVRKSAGGVENLESQSQELEAKEKKLKKLRHELPSVYYSIKHAKNPDWKKTLEQKKQDIQKEIKNLMEEIGYLKMK